MITKRKPSNKKRLRESETELTADPLSSPGETNVPTLHRWYLPLLLLLGIAYCWRPLLGSDDFWGHIAFGRWIVENQQIPRHTLMLWTYEVPWVDHGWLAQVWFYMLMKVGGNRGGPYLALLFTVVVISTVLIVLWRLWAKHSRISSLTPFLFALVILIAHSRFVPRPELFTTLFLTLLLVFLGNWPHDPASAIGNPRRVIVTAVCIVLLFIGWANLHGGSGLGLALLAATAIFDLVQYRGAKWARGLLLLAALCIAVLFINPYGFKYLEAWQQTRSVQFQFMHEWKPFWKPPAIMIIGFAEAILWLIAALAWALNKRRRFAHGAWLLVAAAAFISARRFMLLSALICLAVMAVNSHSLDAGRWLSEWLALRHENGGVTDERIVNLRVPARVAVIVCLLLWIATSPMPLVLPPPAISLYVPQGIVNFIAEQKLTGKVFNDDDDAAYLHWSFGSRLPLFIDQTNAFPDDLLVQYQNILGFTAYGKGLLDVGGIDWVLLRSPQGRETWPPLAIGLSASKKWALVYAGDDGLIWVRRIPKFEPIWRTHRVQLPSA